MARVSDENYNESNIPVGFPPQVYPPHSLGVIITDNNFVMFTHNEKRMENCWDNWYDCVSDNFNDK